jgi:hypothetical protein
VTTKISEGLINTDRAPKLKQEGYLLCATIRHLRKGKASHKPVHICHIASEG